VELTSKRVYWASNSVICYEQPRSREVFDPIGEIGFNLEEFLNNFSPIPYLLLLDRCTKGNEFEQCLG
jgi:hypothetical protein